MSSQICNTPSQICNTPSQICNTPSQICDTSSHSRHTSSAHALMRDWPWQNRRNFATHRRNCATRRRNTPSQCCNAPSQICNMSSQICDTPSQICNTPSQNCNTPSQTPSQVARPRGACHHNRRIAPMTHHKRIHITTPSRYRRSTTTLHRPCSIAGRSSYRSRLVHSELRGARRHGGV